jgi:hypothetical protein
VLGHIWAPGGLDGLAKSERVHGDQLGFESVAGARQVQGNEVHTGVSAECRQVGANGPGGLIDGLAGPDGMGDGVDGYSVFPHRQHGKQTKALLAAEGERCAVAGGSNGPQQPYLHRPLGHCWVNL